MRGKKLIKFITLLIALVVVVGGSIVLTLSLRNLATGSVSEFDWQASPFKVYVAQAGDGDWYKIIGIFSDGSGQEELITLSKAEWREQQAKYMEGFNKNDNNYSGTSLSPNGQINISFSSGSFWQKKFYLKEEGREVTMIDGLVWPQTWLFAPKAFYWMPDSRHILVENKGSIYIVQAADGQYAKLINGEHPSLYQPQEAQ